MSSDLARYVVNPGPKAAVTGLEAAVTTDSSIVTGIVDWFERYLRNNHDSL